MKPSAARKTVRIVGGLLIAASIATTAVAKPQESVARVTDAYKQWVMQNGHTLKDRVRIVLRANRIEVRLEHEAGSTKLIYSPDGTIFLGEITEVESTSPGESTCVLRFRCKGERRVASAKSSTPKRQVALGASRPSDDDDDKPSTKPTDDDDEDVRPSDDDRHDDDDRRNDDDDQRVNDDDQRPNNDDDRRRVEDDDDDERRWKDDEDERRWDDDDKRGKGDGRRNDRAKRKK